MDGPEIESQCGARVSARSVPDVGPAKPPVHLVPFSCQGVKRRGHGIDHPPSSSDDVKERVELCSPSLLDLHGLFYGKLYLYLFQSLSGFGGLEVACWPLVPKFAGSHPGEAVRFLGRKNPQHSFLRRGSKAVGPMS
jgi:hypothetical protein